MTERDLLPALADRPAGLLGPQPAAPRIVKSPAALRAAPNLADYDRVRAAFSWEAARRELDGLPEPGFVPGEELRRSILAHARRRLGAAVAPKEIDFLAELPRTRSGKILRRLLKARELGLAEGDLSTLETGAPEPEESRR